METKKELKMWRMLFILLALMTTVYATTYSLSLSLSNDTGAKIDDAASHLGTNKSISMITDQITTYLNYKYKDKTIFLEMCSQIGKTNDPKAISQGLECVKPILASTTTTTTIPLCNANQIRCQGAGGIICCSEMEICNLGVGCEKKT
jgi:hypothetical protein